MATFDNNFRSGYIVRINWWVNSQDIANNCTNITVQAQLISTGSSYTIRASAVKNGTLNIDGTNYNFTFNASLSGNQTKTVYEQTVNIYHNSDGTRSCYIGLDLGIAVTLSGTYWGTVSTSGTATFDTIPRKSVITGISGDWFGDTMRITIDKKSGSFTTSVYLVVGGEWFNTVWRSGETEFSFTIPLDAMNKIPSATECTAQVIVQTWNGDSHIGSDTLDRWLGIPNWVTPAITGVDLNTDTQVNGSWMWVQYKSKLRVTTHSNGSYGSWITSVRVEFDGAYYWGDDIWTSMLSNSGDRLVGVTVWDSRGRTATWSGHASVGWYQNPWGTLSAYRCDANGNRDDTGGKYVRVTYSGDRAQLSGANPILIALDHKESGKEWSPNDASHTSSVGDTSIVIGSETAAYDLEKSYEIRLRISDWFTTTTKTVPISTAFVLMDFKAGGKGLGIGRVATKDHMVQMNLGLEIFSGRENNPNIGADIVFRNVGNEGNDIAICGAQPNSDELLCINRFTESSSGSSRRLWTIDKWNVIYNNANVEYHKGDIIFYDTTEGHMFLNNTHTYLYFNTLNIGAWNDTHGLGWRYNHETGQFTIRAGYDTASDRRIKYNFDEFSNWEDYYNFYMSLKPQTFKYNNDVRELTHIGMIAQDVADSLVDNNLMNEKLCLVQYAENDAMEDGREYSLAYQEFIPLNIKMIQKHEEEIKELNNIVARQQEEIDQLKDMVNQLVNQGGK